RRSRVLQSWTRPRRWTRTIRGRHGSHDRAPLLISDVEVCARRDGVLVLALHSDAGVIDADLPLPLARRLAGDLERWSDTARPIVGRTGDGERGQYVIAP